MMTMFSLEVLEPDNDTLMQFIEAYWMISKSRYLNKRDPVPRAPDTLDFWLNQLDERRFTQDFRVTRFQFTQIVDLIKDNPVFFNNSNVPQTPAW
ncbi:hypothetical protein F441_17818 [Phytophthora nicotianae CJ01A1]|uniref:Uncharacterized protein n=6 Tax=Phytophthora nicotianae TaxID=4792 RepID=W2R0J7_PHYN3|nr:hypothetical protein PPTG_04325 [Phytophthora nicotianae INRA-310]ETI35785.1 hypothetical protein F443_17948 [Phytophthora nicotianae P1569]ETK76025.1 hypothetical protein L915_17469 [Phytophthora nicotianae]ETO64516.1 hypothetical protein F444_17975 [Phytophthora nicotianae P1976]ETP05611.1 hypothetical protein F441_17818 [Phytophthora nicotianae CJ01A1]ETP33731.1 hypothetical protein F442_17795 [Phytophthora nicotianae P10297]